MKILIINKLPVLKNKSLVSVTETERIITKFSEKNTIVEANYWLTNAKKLFKYPWDVIILTSTTLSERVSVESLEKLKTFLAPLKNHSAYKVAMPQDDYHCPEDLDQLLSEIEIDLLVTVFNKERFFLYPKISSNPKCDVIQGQTIYLTNTYNSMREKFYTPIEKRPHDVFYKATNNPVFPNNLGLKKALLSNSFEKALNGKQVKTNFPKSQNLFTGNKWFKMLSNSKSILGSNSGSDFIIRNAVSADAFKKEFSALSREDRERPINEFNYKGIEKTVVPMTAISPRNIDAASLGTMQILVEGSYSNILKPGIDYIETDFEFHNMEYLLQCLNNFKLMRDITDNAWNTINNSPSIRFNGIFQFIINKSNLKKSLKSQTYLPPQVFNMFNHSLSQLIKKELYLVRKSIKFLH
jgi:hypothetical protein